LDNTDQKSNFVKLLKLCKTLKLVARISKFFSALLKLFLRYQQNYFDTPTKLFSDLYPAKF